jgi:hypothetical protein
VIEPPDDFRRRFSPGERLSFRLMLVGRAIHFLPYFVFTFTELGRTGLGPEHGQYCLQEVYEEGLDAERQIYSGADGVLHETTGCVTARDLAADESPVNRFTIHFLTPTRIYTDGRVRAKITFQDLVRALLRR